MNIIDAVKSGKRFRRKSWKANEMNWISQDRGDLPLQLTRDDIVAEDWELKQEPVPITREQFNKACQSVLGRFASDHILVVCWLGLTKSERTITAVLTDLAEELGL